LGQREALCVEADKAVWHADRQRLRCLRIKMQAQRRLPGLQRGDQVGPCGAEQRCRRNSMVAFSGCRPVEQAGIILLAGRN
jgi:hypothetical protein